MYVHVAIRFWFCMYSSVKLQELGDSGHVPIVLATFAYLLLHASHLADQFATGVCRDSFGGTVCRTLLRGDGGIFSFQQCQRSGAEDWTKCYSCFGVC